MYVQLFKLGRERGTQKRGSWGHTNSSLQHYYKDTFQQHHELKLNRFGKSSSLHTLSPSFSSFFSTLIRKEDSGVVVNVRRRQPTNDATMKEKQLLPQTRPYAEERTADKQKMCLISCSQKKKITLTEFRSKQQKENSLKHHASEINQFFFSERVNLSWLSKLLLKCDKTL